MASGIDKAAVAPTSPPLRAGPHEVVAKPSDTDATDRVSPRAVWIILTLVTFVAASLRFLFLNHQSLWLDEIFTREIVAEPTLSGLWHRIRQTESTPPLSYVIAWLIGARSTAALRVIPASALTAAVPISYAAFRRLVGQPVALATAAIVAVCPMLVAYSTDARSYGLLVLTALLTVWGFSAVLERPSGRRYALWALACIACVWTHYFGGFFVVAEATMLLVLRGRERLTSLGWSLVIAVCLGPLVPLAVDQAGSGRTEFIEAESLASRVLTTVRQFAMGANVPRTWLEAAGLCLWCLVAGCGAVVAARRGSGARLVLVLALFGLGLPLLMGITGIEDRFYDRNVIAAVPIVAALAAPVMLRMRALPFSSYLVVALLTSLWVATNWRYEQPDWRDAIERVETANPHIPLIAVTRSAIPVVRTYLGRAESAPVGLVTQSAWVVIEPTRGAHDRAFVPTSAPAIRGFTAVRELRAYAFRIILVVARQPARIASGMIPNSTVFPGRS